MARMLVIYKTPKDIAAFEKHYWDVHIPLAKGLPGLRKYEVSRGPIAVVAGDKNTYLIATLYFDSMDAIKEAFASECGQACARDRRILAPNDEDVQMFLVGDFIDA
ncbi:MAG: EthD family reductase [Bdellovibrio sp.]|nr:EthD family reductase [Bdellovibrio sp.]